MSAQPTVLLALNERELLDALCFELNRRGYRVVTALSGDGAAALADMQLPDIAVLDMLLAGRNGFQLTQELKDRSNGGISVVMISEHAAAAHRDYAFAAGVDWFLEKRLAPARLSEAVELLCPTTKQRKRPGSGTIPKPAITPS